MMHDLCTNVNDCLRNLRLERDVLAGIYSIENNIIQVIELGSGRKVR
jgi:hypothetical protein